MTIRSMPATSAFREGWDRIFGRAATARAVDPPHECDCLTRRHIDGICQHCGRDNRELLSCTLFPLRQE